MYLGEKGGNFLSRPKVGLALGSGAARGLAHIGVLKVLEREGIPVDMIAGSSMGSLIGVVYANGADLDMMEQLAIHLKRNQWLDFTLPRRGLITGDRIRELVRLLTHGKKPGGSAHSHIRDRDGFDQRRAGGLHDGADRPGGAGERVDSGDF